MSKPKTLCDWSKSDLRDKARDLAALVEKADHYCTKCARVAGDKRVLCKPKRLPVPRK